MDLAAEGAVEQIGQEEASGLVFFKSAHGEGNFDGFVFCVHFF